MTVGARHVKEKAEDISTNKSAFDELFTRWYGLFDITEAPLEAVGWVCFNKETLADDTRYCPESNGCLVRI